MALNLSELKFVVDDSDLKRASDTIGNLVTNVGKLDKAARDAAQTEATLARAAKDNAKANLDNAKAQDVRLKSTITADGADQQATAVIERKTKATERASTAIKKNADMLQLQNDTYDFILEGFSKGDAKVLAMAKATGQLSDQLKQVLTDIRQFSKNTFDQTETGLDRMVKSAKEASSAQGFLNNGLNLTSKQAKELSNDLDRLNIRLQHQGKSYQEITKEQAIYKQRFVEEANAVNRATSALAAVEKQRKDVVSATNYLTQAEAKMAAALNTSNAALDKAGTDLLVKYETALRKSGVSQDVATLKLAKYKAQLEQVQIQEQKRREQHLTRALAPQATDVVVSLWSGQNPLTVLLQQGGQVTDLFMQSGIAAEKFGEVVKSSMKSMLPSILTVVKGVGGLLVDGFMAAGNATRGFIADIFGVTGAMDKFYMKLSENGPSKFGGMIQTASSILTGVFAVGIAVVVAGLVALGIGLKQVIEENNELAKTLALSGGQLGLSHAAAIQYAKSMELTGVSTGESIKVISEMAKAGNLGKDSINMITRAAIDMEAYAGVSIEETVKAFSKFKDKPVEALVELAKQTGLVSEEVLKSVRTLQEQGDQLGAASLAMAAYADVTRQQSARIKEDYNGLSLFFKELGKSIGDYWDGIFKNLFRLPSKTESLEASLGILKDKLTDARKNVDMAGPVFATERQKQEVKDLESRIRAITSEIGASVRVEGERQRAVSNNIANAKADEQTAALRAKYATTEQQALAEITKLRKQEELWKKDGLLTDERRLIIESGIAAEQKKIDKAREHKPSPSENYFATLMREATNNTIAANTAAQELTKSEQKLLEVRSDPRFEKLTATQKQDVISKYEAAIAAEKQTALTEKLAEAEEHRLKLLGKSEGIGKQYYSDMQKLEEFAKVAGWSREEVEELTRAVFKSTPAWKAYEKALEDVKNAARKFNEDSLASQAATLKENESLDYRLSLLGKTAEEQRALSIEYNRANKISEVRIKLAKQLRDIEADIEKAKKAGLPEEKYKNLIDAQVQARKDAAEQEKVINREVAVQYREDFQREFIDPIRNGLTDSIVTALFEGGKSGSKKLRDLVVAQLRKPVTMVVNAVVNTILGNTVGSLMGGAAAGGTGSLSSTAGGIGNLLGGLGSFGSTVAGGIGSVVGSVFGVGAGNVALGTSLGLGASSSTAAALAAAQAGGAAGGAGAAGMGSFLSGLGAAMPYIGAAIALISLIGGMDDSGTYHTGGAASYSVATGQRNSLGFRDNEEGLPSYNPNDNIDNQFGTGFGYVVPGKETISAMETLSKSLVDIFDGIAKTFGKTAGYEVAVAFADDTSKDGAWGAFAVRLQGVEILNWDDFRKSKWAPKEFGDGEEGYKQYLAAIAKDTRQVILDMDLPSWADQVLNEIGDAPSLESLSKAIQELAQMKSMYDLMTSQMVNFAGITDEAFGKLIKEFGDIGTMTNQVTGYYQNYYSEFERFNKAQADVTKSFTDLGLTMPTSREEFRKLAESQDLNTEAGRKMYAQLMALAASFGVVIDAAEQLANARTDIVYRMMEQEALLLEAQGRSAEADKKRREILDKQRGAEYERLMKVNPELARLTAELWALEDAAVAAALERELSDNRRDYTDRILQQEAELLAAQGRTAEADKKRRELLDRQRARENERLMALNPELAKLAYELWLLEDATIAASNAAAKAKEIADTRQGLTDRILQQEAELLDAQGRTAEADRKRRELLDRQRARENERLMALNPELARLAYELWLLEDATAAATRAAKERKEISNDLYNALAKAVDAEKTLLNEQKARLEETVSTLKAVFDILKSSVEDLYGEVSSTAAMQASEGRGVIAQAIATGVLPDSKLLDTSIQAVRDEISNSLYVSKADADKARLIFAAQLALLKDTTEEQLTDAEKQLKAVNVQISYLDNILKTAKEQLDAFLGNTEVLKSVDKALADLYAFLQNPSAAKPVPKPVGTEKPGNNAGTGGGAVFGPGTGTSKPSTVNSDGNIVYADGSIGYRNSWIDNSGVKHYGFVSKDIWETERAIGTPGYPAFANGGYYQGGMALVGEEGPELINFSNPGQVYTARQTASMLSGESSEVVAELKAVRSEIIMLRAEVRADVSHNAKTAKLLDRVIPEGDSVQVTIS